MSLSKHTKTSSRKKKLIITSLCLTIIAVAGFAGYRLTLNFASDKLMEQVAQQVTPDEVNQIMESPEIRKLVQQQTQAQAQGAAPVTPTPNAQAPKQPQTSAQAQGGSAMPAPASPSVPDQAAGAAKPVAFKNKEEALKFVLSKFTMSELNALAAKATRGLTPEVKEEIKSTLLSRMTVEEYTALKVLGIIEISTNEKYKDVLK